MSEYKELYRDDFMIVSTHHGEEVGVQVGRPPEEATPTIVNARELVDCLTDHLEEVDQ